MVIYICTLSINGYAYMSMHTAVVSWMTSLLYIMLMGLGVADPQSF